MTRFTVFEVYCMASIVRRAQIWIQDILIRSLMRHHKTLIEMLKNIVQIPVHTLSKDAGLQSITATNQPSQMMFLTGAAPLLNQRNQLQRELGLMSSSAKANAVSKKSNKSTNARSISLSISNSHCMGEHVAFPYRVVPVSVICQWDETGKEEAVQTFLIHCLWTDLGELLRSKNWRISAHRYIVSASKIFIAINHTWYH